MRPLKISAISFLNTVPLMWDFEHDPSLEIRENFEVEYTVPSLCAQALREGAADIGIIPVITTAQIPGLVVLPDVAIAALQQGAVDSVGEQEADGGDSHGCRGHVIADFGGADAGAADEVLWRTPRADADGSACWGRCWRAATRDC